MVESVSRLSSPILENIQIYSAFLSQLKGVISFAPFSFQLLPEADSLLLCVFPLCLSSDLAETDSLSPLTPRDPSYQHVRDLTFISCFRELDCFTDTNLFQAVPSLI